MFVSTCSALQSWAKFRSSRLAVRRRHHSLLHHAAASFLETLEIRRLLTISSIPAVVAPVADWTFDEGAGASAADSSGNAHTLTLGANASWTTGNLGAHAIKFNGTATSVATATGPVVNTANSFTVSAWVNLAAVSGYETAVSIAGTNVAGFFLGLRGDTGALSFARLPSDAAGTATVVAATSAPLVGTWYHMVGVSDASAGTLSLYIDGQAVGTAAFTSGWTASGNTLIGHGFYNGGQVDYVNGSVDDVQFFSAALSAAQVAALDQPAAYSFDDGSGSTAADVSGHGNTLTLGTGASWSTGKVGSNALTLNGTSTGNALSASPVLNTAQSFSLSAMVNLNSLATSQTFVSIDGVHTSAFEFQYRADTGKFAFTRASADTATASTVRADATTAPTVGTWYNLIAINNATTGQIQLYVNGAIQSTTAYTTGWQATGATVVGAGKANDVRANFANGSIDDLHFYNTALSAPLAVALGTGGNSTINIALGSNGITVSPTLFGAFMEDINYGGEGGIYNDEIRNSGFNDSTNALNAWSAITGTGASATLASDATTGPTAALTESGKLTIASGVSASARAGIANTGYFGVAVAPSTSYTVDFYAKASAGFTGPLTVSLESTTGTVYATATIASITSSWAEYTATLTTSASAPTSSANRLVISTNSPSANGKTLWFGATYLFPPSYNNQPNHLRTDLMQKLAAMHPAIFRIPGGNYLEGNTYSDRFEWSNTLGRVQDRPGHYNSAWGYWSTDGMGLDEYLQMAEEIGSTPLLAVYAGYTLNGTSDTGTTLTNDVTDAVNELHYVLDPVTTTWGALRAANGHPAPYNIPYVEVGNEDFFSSTYATRYPLFYNAIHAAFPQLQIIATTTSTGGAPFDILDDHFYHNPAWFESNSGYFDNTARGSYKIFIGEYASNEGSPTNDMNSALGDASWLLGLERNSDLVTMSSYAPIWANTSSIQWDPDLIGFNNTSSYGSPSYYAQVMLQANHGTTVVSDTVTGAGLQTLVTRTGSTYYLTVINTGSSATNAAINLGANTSVSPTAALTTMSAPASNSTNSISNPTNIVPTMSTITGLAPLFNYTFAPFSINILQFTATPDTPTVATAAAANPSPVIGTSTALSVLGADVSGEAGLTYTWANTGPASVAFSANGSNTAKNTTATFTSAGSYIFTVTITNANVGTTVTSSVPVIVNQTPSGFAITPSSATVISGGTVSFAAGTVDQFGNLLGTQPPVTWSVLTGGGTINGAGVYTAGSIPGTVTVKAVSGGNISTSTVTVPAAVAWYKADASSGTTLADSSGNAQSATLSGATSFATGVSGNALALSGGYASLPAGIVSSLNDFTIAAWVNVATLSQWERIFDFGTGTNNYMFLTPDASTGKLRFAFSNSGYTSEQQLNGPAITPGVWTHIAVTLSGNIGTLYVNGVAVATNAAMTIHPSTLGSTTQNYLGKSQFSADPAFTGSIDDFRIYGQALSAQQIFQLAAPSVVLPPASAASPVIGTSTTLSVLATDITAGESALHYTWSIVGTPPAAVTFSDNGTNTAKITTATFTKAGTYTFQVTIVDPAAGVPTTATVSTTVHLLLGDANDDGIVDANDLATVLNHLGATTSAWANGNFDNAATVDLSDLNAVLNNLGRTVATVTAVSEPDAPAPVTPITPITPTSPAPVESTPSDPVFTSAPPVPVFSTGVTVVSPGVSFTPTIYGGVLSILPTPSTVPLPVAPPAPAHVKNSHRPTGQATTHHALWQAHRLV